MKMSKGAYIHIPFCNNICSYCDFCKMFYKKSWADNYLVSLKNEVEDRYHNEEIKTLYIGGGTPSCLNNEQLEFLLKIATHLNVSNLEEFTIECNLNDINEDFLTLISKYHVNRLSIGIESFNEDVLKKLNRHHTFEDAKQKINLCRQYNISNINLDLIYAINGETLKDVKEDLKLFLKLKPDHISTYSLIIEDHTLLKINNEQPIDDELDYDMYEYICKVLKSKGYHHYEISNFAKPGFESKHNLIYWHNEEYYGFGLGACGYIDKVRNENTKSLTKYLNGEYVKEFTLIGEDTRMDNEIMLGLRLTNGISLKEFEEKYQKSIFDAYDLKSLIKNNDLVKKKNHIYIHPDKLYIMNEILIKII